MEALNQPGGRIVLGEKEIHFATNQAAIPADVEPALMRVAKTLKDNPAWRVRIEGFTDNVGSRAANAQLSQQRADSVKNWLVDHGVDQSRVHARGFGESRPVASNDTEDGRARNRRVEIVRIGAAMPTGE